MDGDDLTAFFPVTGQCNLSCRYCFYRTGYEGRPPEYDFRDKKRFISSLKEAGVGQIIITGGEPLYRIGVQTLGFMREAKDAGMDLLLLTNGTNFSDYKENALAEIKPEVGVSLDSSFNENNKYLRGKQVRTVTRTIERLAKREVPVKVISVMTTVNTNVRRTYECAMQAGARDIIFQPVFIPNGMDKEGLDLSYINRDELSRIFGNLERWAEDTGKEKYLGLMRNWFLGGDIDLGQRCRMGERLMVVYPGGAATECFHTRKQLGSIYDPDFFEVERRELLKNKKRLPGCFGLHCMSLYANPAFWEE